MIDIDPGLDTQLQAFFEHIEASAPPPGLTDIDVTAPARRRRAINLMAGLAAAAVVAGSVAVFALELRSHNAPAPGPATTSSSPSGRPSASPSALKKMPLLGTAGIPASAHEVMPLRRGQGSVVLKSFVPQGTLYIQFDCAGPGPFKIISTDRVIGDGLLQLQHLGQCLARLGVKVDAIRHFRHEGFRETRSPVPVVILEHGGVGETASVGGIVIGAAVVDRPVHELEICVASVGVYIEEIDDAEFPKSNVYAAPRQFAKER